MNPILRNVLAVLAGAFAAARIAASAKLPIALGIGVLFLCGGVAAAFMIPAPTWFIALDLAGAYLPMAWLGWKLAAPRS